MVNIYVKKEYERWKSWSANPTDSQFLLIFTNFEILLDDKDDNQFLESENLSQAYSFFETR